MVIVKKNVRTPVQKRSKDKINKILDTSKQLFTEKNYFNVTTNEIAKKAGLSIGTLYSYFSDKEAILIALLTNYNNNFLQLFNEINTQEFLETFRSNPKLWLETLMDKLLKKENKDFHAQIEMLAFTIPKVKIILEEHNTKVKDLTYQSLLYYTDHTENQDFKILSEIIFNFISATIDDLLYSEHSIKEKELLKSNSIDYIALIINNAINKK